MKIKLLFRFLFHREAIALPAGLAFMWLTVSLLADGRRNKSDLVAHTGRITRMDSVIVRVKDKPFFKEVTKELQLALLICYFHRAVIRYWLLKHYPDNSSARW